MCRRLVIPFLLATFPGVCQTLESNDGCGQGFLGWVSYLGAACAGVPISAIVQQRGWDAYFLALLASCAIVLALLAPTLNLKSREQVDAAKTQ